MGEVEDRVGSLRDLTREEIWRDAEAELRRCELDGAGYAAWGEKWGRAALVALDVKAAGAWLHRQQQYARGQV
jgi:hypothetical protein